MESSTGAATETDGIRVTARTPATTPPASKRLRNVDPKMCAANDDIGVFSTSQGTRVRNLLSKIPHAHSEVTRVAPALPGRIAALIALRFRSRWCLWTDVPLSRTMSAPGGRRHTSAEHWGRF